MDVENNTIEVLGDEDEAGSGLDDAQIDDLLGQDSGLAASVTVTQPTTAAPVAPVQPVTPQVPNSTPEQDAAFASQRRWYEQQLQTQQNTIAGMQQQLGAVLTAQQPVQVQPTFEELYPMPDPVDKPKEFGEWAVARAKHELTSTIEQTNQRTEAIAQTQEVQAYSTSLDSAARSYGPYWEQLYEAAGRLAVEFPSLKQDVFRSANPGLALAKLGARALGVPLESIHAALRGQPVPQPGQQPAAPQPAPAQLTEAQIRADERAKATKDLQAKAKRSPFNLAHPSIGALPVSPVAIGGGIKRGSAEEDALLGS